MGAHGTQPYREALREVAGRLIERGSIAGALKNKTVLVTGATGQLGSALAYLLNTMGDQASLGMRVLAASRSREAFDRVFGDLPRPQEAPFVRYEATEPFTCDEPVDFVVHCAGYGDPSAFVNDPVGVMQANIYGLDQLLQHLVRQGRGRLLFVSSGEVYGQGAPGIDAFDEGYCGHIDTMNYRSCYQMAKRAGESLCASYAKQFGVDTIVARQCHVYGPGFSARDSRVTAQFLRAARDGQPITMKSEGAQVRSYLFELDAAAAYIWLLAQGEPCTAYNVAPSYTTSIRELGECIAKHANVPFEVKLEQASQAQTGVSGITRSVLDASRLRSTGFSEQFGLDGGVDATIRALRAANQQEGGR